MALIGVLNWKSSGESPNKGGITLLGFFTPLFVPLFFADPFFKCLPLEYFDSDDLVAGESDRFCREIFFLGDSKSCCP
jgi:hypothetical protein